MNKSFLNQVKTKAQQLWSLKDNRYFILAFVGLVIVSLFFRKTNDSSVTIEPQAKIQADTIIPKGYVLLPIYLENIASITGVIEHFGIIDLYAGHSLGGKSKKIATRIKILRAPLNPNEFAVLVPEALSEKIMTETGPFWGVIQNRSVSEGENTIAQVVKKNIQIEYSDSTH